MASDMFCKIEGIPGESTDDKHKEWIELLSYSHGMSQSGGSDTSRAGGRAGARVDISDFQIVKVLETSSPNLARYCCDAKHIPEVIVELCEATGDKHTYMKYTLSDVIISSVSPGGASDGGGSRPVETVSFRFGKIKWAYTPVDHEGNPGATVESGWDLEANKAI